MGNKKNKHNPDNVALFNRLFSEFKAKIASDIQNLGVEGSNPNPEMSQNTHSNEDLLFANTRVSHFHKNTLKYAA